jgi:hypothetical protein
MFDLVSTAELTASAAIVVFFISSMLSSTVRQRVLIAAALTFWFCLVLTAGATGALAHSIGPVPGVGVAVLIPLALLTLLVLGTARGREGVRRIPLAALVGVQGLRVLGITFVLLYWARRLPAPFAPVAGWGDVSVGLLAIPLAVLLARSTGATPKGIVVMWNVLGVLDLVTAVALGATSAAGPLRIFHGEPGTAIMTNLPWVLIPCFLVPSFLFLHLCTFYRLRALVPGERTESLRPVRMAAPAS